VVRFPFGTFPVVIYEVLGLRVQLLQIVIMGTVALSTTALLIYLHYTSSGRQIRAVAVNERTARLLGIKPGNVFAQIFFISGALALDASYYPSTLRIPGIEDTDDAYNALNSALAVNFNTIYAVRSGNKVRSAEKQTPITPLAISQFRLRGPNGSGRISLSQDPMVSLQYAGELIAAFIERAGGSVKGKISTGLVPKGLEPVYVHRQSRTLSEILVELLRVSNNYIANQVFLEIGGHRLGGQVSLEKSLQVANEMLAAHGLAAAIHLEEGSGISRNNHFTARGLAKVLELFAPHADLLRGHDGGMNKTGTMEGVRTLAGYADTSGHGRVRFVISLTSNDDKMRFRLLRTIESGL
jgi:D-alanyl-D-alanine carboxypeptidase/D-alanyl-D-alanine-endopeptidase (penicillin-binding protein 4)